MQVRPLDGFFPIKEQPTVAGFGPVAAMAPFLLDPADEAAFIARRSHHLPPCGVAAFAIAGLFDKEGSMHG